MINGRVASSALTALLVAGLAVSGCAGQAAAGETSAREALTASLAGIEAGNYTFTVDRPDDPSSKITGAAHLPQSSKISFGSSQTVLRVGPENFLQYLAFGHPDTYAAFLKMSKNDPSLQQLDGKHWLSFDQAQAKKVADDQDHHSGLIVPEADTKDLTGVADLIATVGTATGSGNVISGTLDGTHIAGIPGIVSALDESYVGPRAKAVPFRATLDDQGRLTRFEATIPGALADQASAAPAAPDAPVDPNSPDYQVVVTITGYGTAPVDAKPTSVRKMTAAMYEIVADDRD